MNRRAFLSAAAASSLVSASARAQAVGPLGRFRNAAAFSAERDGASFIVVRNGIVLAENYAGGEPGARWPIGAGSKSFAAILAGSLAAEDMLSLDELVAYTFPEWTVHPIKAAISVRALLNGTSGIAFNGRPSDIQAALSLEPAAALGERFIDDPAPYMILVEIARRKLAMAGRLPDPAQYLTDRTLGPIGCAPVGFTRSADGAPLLYDGIVVSARGWAQAGELVRRAGVWRATQLLQESAALEALRGTFAEPRCGMGFWLAAGARGADPAGVDTDLWRRRSPAPIDLAMAAGDGGQRLYVIPSLRLVIVRQARTTTGAWSDAEFLSLVLNDLERA
jgi:CubicO group peptidase (beta-lactamase class C family)